MENNLTTKMYANISQRAASSYLKSMAEFTFVQMEGGGLQQGEEMAVSQRVLHAFFKVLYANLYERPGLFGLPLSEDSSIAEDEPNAKDKKQEVNRMLKKPKAMIASGLDFLMLAGLNGNLEGQALNLNGFGALIKQSKVGRKFLQGFESAGLTISEANDTAVLMNTQFPQMMAALRALAASCAVYESEKLGKYQFAHCDFRTLQNVNPEVMELYRIFVGADYGRLVKLHEYFCDKKYKTQSEIYGPSGWMVKYQGDRKVKATPLFQVEYDDRYARPLRMYIKCASTQRLTELLPKQSQRLQDDFMRRAVKCRGDECGWCRNQKTLGPSKVEYNGEWKELCWYTFPDIHEFNEDTVVLIQQYEQMHARLASGCRPRPGGG